VFYFSFLAAIIIVSIGANYVLGYCLFETSCTFTIGLILLLIAVAMPVRYGKKIRDIAEEEMLDKTWSKMCTGGFRK
jgi:hypothetical protein